MKCFALSVIKIKDHLGQGGSCFKDRETRLNEQADVEFISARTQTVGEKIGFQALLNTGVETKIRALHLSSSLCSTLPSFVCGPYSQTWPPFPATV